MAQTQFAYETRRKSCPFHKEISSLPFCLKHGDSSVVRDVGTKCNSVFSSSAVWKQQLNDTGAQLLSWGQLGVTGICRETDVAHAQLPHGLGVPRKPQHQLFQGKPDTSMGHQELACALGGLLRAGDMSEGRQPMGLPYTQGQPGGEGHLWVLAWNEVWIRNTHHLLLQDILLLK